MTHTAVMAGMGDRSDYIRSVGGGALGGRLRRLSERIDRDSARVYVAQGLPFEQRWYGLINQLVLNGPMSVGDIAMALRITHVSVSQSSRSLEKAGIITSAPDPDDARKRRLALTAKGREVVERLTPVWEGFIAAAEELNEEAGDVVALLDRLDDALDRRSMFERIMQRIAGVRS